MDLLRIATLVTRGWDPSIGCRHSLESVQGRNFTLSKKKIEEPKFKTEERGEEVLSEFLLKQNISDRATACESLVLFAVTHAVASMVMSGSIFISYGAT